MDAPRPLLTNENRAERAIGARRHAWGVRLWPLEGSERLELVAGWLSQKENWQWLDFGDGRQSITPAWLKIMAQRDTHLLRVYSPADDDSPIGVVALSEINRHFGTARLWAASGDKSLRHRGYATAASAAMLSVGFHELGLHAVNTWVVDGNPSERTVRRLHFTFIGRQRACHYIDGRPFDRLWFDLLASEHERLNDG